MGKYFSNFLEDGISIAIVINCDVVPYQHNDNLIQVTENIHIDPVTYLPSYPKSVDILEDEHEWFIRGVQLVEKLLLPKLSNETSYIINIVYLAYDLVDYHPNAFAYAIAGWLNQEYDLGWQPENPILNKLTQSFRFRFEIHDSLD